jgi:hypothetical protein
LGHAAPLQDKHLDGDIAEALPAQCFNLRVQTRRMVSCSVRAASRRDRDVVPPAAPQLTSTDPASPNSSGTPRIRGAAEAGSTVRVYAGANCAGTSVANVSAAELGSPGIRVEVGEGVTAAFSPTATDAAGNTSACSTSISYTRPPHGDPPGRPGCVVPKLAGEKLARAKAALAAAGCKVGVVHKPKPRNGKGRRPLVVKSSTPAQMEIPLTGRGS